ADAREIVAVMARGAERTAAIVKDLRSFSRLDEATRKRVDLQDGLEVSLRLLEPRWRDRIEIHRDYGTLPPVECDPGQVNQVFMNVLANACDAIPGRGNLWLTTRAEGDRVRVTIRDDGVGMAPEVVGRIFDPFFTTKDVGGGTGLGLLETHEPAVIVADQRMPAMSGTEFLERSMAVRPDAVRIILTGYTDIDAIIQAINKSRIYRYVTKPWESEELRLTLRRAVEAFHLVRENGRLVEELRRANERLAAENAYLREIERPNEIVGESAAMRSVLELIARVASSRTTVLIEGETGTGKELVARAIHAAGPRRDHLFVAVNCAALSEGLLESELFGHRRGAFTGATEDRKGLFEVAGGGTLFLDEISETSPALQAKLLRVLQEGEVRPVGENRPRTVDARVIV